MYRFNFFLQRKGNYSNNVTSQRIVRNYSHFDKRLNVKTSEHLLRIATNPERKSVTPQNSRMCKQMSLFTSTYAFTANFTAVSSPINPSFAPNVYGRHFSTSAVIQPDTSEALLKKLNETVKNNPQDLVAFFNNTKSGINEEVIKQYLKALVETGQLEKVPLKDLVARFLPNGSSESNPIFVQTLPEGVNIWRALGGILFLAILIYLLVFKGGGFNELFQSTYTPAETNVNITFSDVKGSEEAKEELRDIVEYLKNPSKFKRMNAKLPKGVLLTGPPGCGKTLMAKALAGEAGVPFFYVSGSEFEEMLVGVGARRVRTLFKQAKEMAPCIIFIDEIDAIGARRDHPDNRTKMTLNQLLVELDGFGENKGIIVIAATNLPKVLDPALTRPGRFDRQVAVSLPDWKARKDIIELYLGDRAHTNVNIDYLSESTAGFSGADLFNMVNSAAIEATKKNLRMITMHLLENARENVMLGPERKNLTITPETKNITAYHEAGHALVAFLSPSPHTQIVRATLVPRGDALGMVRYMLKNELLVSKEALETQLLVAMGGRVAEELIFGPRNATQGAASDFAQATKLAYEMVSQYGMNDKIGHVSYSDHNTTEQTKFMMETEARALIEASYIKTKEILRTHKQELELLAQALLKHETLTLNEIEAVLAGKDISELKAKKRKEEEELRLREEDELRIIGLPEIDEQKLVAQPATNK